MDVEELASSLKPFYVEARNYDGKPYSRNTMKAIRSGLDRYLSSSPHRKPFFVIRNHQFKPANEALDATLKEFARQGVISSTKHKPAIRNEDLEALYSAGQLGLETPESLVNTAWFYILLYFGKRGGENQRAMTSDDLELKTTSTEFDATDESWFCNVPMGKNKLENLLTCMCKKANLQKIYTPHCIRATSVTLLRAAGLENSRVKSVTGHSSDKSIESYSSRPTIEQQCQSSAIVSHFVGGNDLDNLPQFNVLPTATTTVQTIDKSQRNVIQLAQANFNVTPGDSVGPNFSSSTFHGAL